jgi:hypothetical protein
MVTDMRPDTLSSISFGIGTRREQMMQHKIIGCVYFPPVIFLHRRICRFSTAYIPNGAGKLHFIATTCLLSEYTKLRSRPSVIEFLNKHEIAVTFPAYLDLERGIKKIAPTQPKKAEDLRRWLDQLLEKKRYVDGMSPEVGKLFAAMLDCKSLRNLWLPSPQAKHPSFGMSLMVAAISIVNDLPIATLSWKSFGKIDGHFPLPGLYDPQAAAWLSQPARRKPATLDMVDAEAPTTHHR